MPRTRAGLIERERAARVSQSAELSLRSVVQAHADCCFLDTDGVTRSATRMLQILDGWRSRRTDREAGVRRNGAFDPNLPVVLTAGTRICHPERISHPGQPELLFTIVTDTAA